MGGDIHRRAGPPPTRGAGLRGAQRGLQARAHIARRFRAIALQSAVGGMAASVIGMGFAAAGLLPPTAGALLQEAIDLVAVANALRMAWPPRSLTDYAA